MMYRFECSIWCSYPAKDVAEGCLGIYPYSCVDGLEKVTPFKHGNCSEEIMASGRLPISFGGGSTLETWEIVGDFRTWKNCPLLEHWDKNLMNSGDT